MTLFAIEPRSVRASQCDGKSNPCPLQKWERDNSGTPMANGELAKVAKSMEQIKKWGGPNMKDWAKMAQKTAEDAKASKVDDVKADCKACHDAYRAAYQNDPVLRNKPLL